MTVETETVAAPDGWEPATFVLQCPRRHTWGSYGRYHAPTSTVRPRFPKCPRVACGQHWAGLEMETGPHRSSVVEPKR